MPTVPYQPIPEVQPGQAGTPGVQVSTPIAAFGGTVAQALSGLGSKVEHAGDQIWQQAVKIQHERNEADARWADAEYMKEAGELHAKFNSLEGNAIAEAYPKYIADLRKAQLNIRDTLTNPEAKKMYDGPSTSFLGRSIFNGAGVAAAGAKAGRRQAQEAQLDGFRQAAAANPNDDIGFEEYRQRSIRIIKSRAAEARWDSAVTEHEIKKAESALKTDRIIGQARTAPQSALGMFQDYGPDLTVQDRARAESVVYGRVAQVAGRNEADAVLAPTLGTDKQKPLNDYLDAGRKAVDKMNVEDESLRVQIKNGVENYITAKYHQQQNAKTDLERLNMSTINNALTPGPDGKIPTSVDEVFAKPGVQQAYNDLDGTRKKQAFNAITAAVSKKHRYDDQTSWRGYEKLAGMANSDPNAFLNVDPWDAQYKMNPSEIHKVIKLQDQKRKDPATDPEVKKTIGLLTRVRGPELRELGITSRADNPEKWDEFTGALFVAIRDYQEANKKNPSEDEKLDMADKLMFRPPATTFPRNLLPQSWSMGKDKPLIQEPVPDDYAAEIRNSFWAKGQPAPSDQEIRRIYLRDRLQKIHGKGKSSSADQPGDAE